MTGNVLSGWTVIVSSRLKMFMRVMHDERAACR